MINDFINTKINEVSFAFMGEFKVLLKNIINDSKINVYYETIPSTDTKFPVIVYDKVQITQSSDNIFSLNIDINIFDNQTNDILNIEKLTGKIYQNLYKAILTTNDKTIKAKVMNIQQNNIKGNKQEIRQRNINVVMQIWL
jgi:hypothetical protein